MTIAALCLLVPLMGGCERFSTNAPSIGALSADPRFDKSRVVVSGRVERLLQRRSKYTGKKWESFYVCQAENCVRVYLPHQTIIRNGDRVRVTGEYYRAFHSGEAVYYNEIEATQIVNLR